MLKTMRESMFSGPRRVWAVATGFFRREIWRRDWGLLVAFVGVSFLDVELQWQALFDWYRIASVVIKSICAGLALCAPAFWFGSWSRWVYVPLWCWFCFIEVVECVTLLKFGRVLDGDWLMIVMTSSSAEFLSFWQSFSVGGLFSAVLICLGGMFAGVWWLVKRKYARCNRYRLLAGGLLLVPVLVFVALRPRGSGAFADMMYYYFLEDTILNFREYADIAETARSPQLPQARLGVPEGVVPHGVIVVGESATRNHMHLYGYGRETTPCMDARRRDLIVFKDVRATQTFTGGSLKMFFTDATEERPDRTYSTLAQRYANVGYSCTLISNQERWGRVEGIESLLFSGCREMVYLKEKSRGRYVFDSDLLPELQACLQRPSGPSVVFLHLMGSHFPFASQYPASLAVYPRNIDDVPPGVERSDTRIRSAVDAYDNTILLTDRLLGRILDQLSMIHRPCFFVYFSDHGETPRSHSVRDLSSPDLYEIPFVIWFSAEYRKLFPNVVKTMEEMAEKSHTADHLLGLFLALARIEEAKRWNE